jgi:hypothetical protein
MSPSENMRRQDGFAGKGDDFYEALLAAHDGLDEQESAALNARLILLLANHIGSLPVLREALALARADVRSGANGSDAGIGTASKNENKQT